VSAIAEVDEQLRVLAANAVHLVTEEDLARKLGRKAPLRVKLGIDPTASDIHLGFAVVLRKLRQFQDLGHVAVLILGDFTALVGDPSGRSVTRPRLSKEEVDAHAESYLEQIRRILSSDRLEVRRNSEWLASMNIEDVLRLTSRTTVARMLERDDFARRYAQGEPISVMELLYPLLQGWDSVMVRADVELGGTDQLFNNLMGRVLQEQEGQEGQVVLTMPLLEGIGGGPKMSKSLGNYIGITESPDTQFGKLMSIPDDLMPSYFALTTGWPPERVEEVRSELLGAEPADRARLKRLLARAVVDLYHGDGAGAAAEAEFDRVFKAHERPSRIQTHQISLAEFGPTVSLARLARLAGLVNSNNEGRRLVAQGGLRLNGEVVTDADAELPLEALDGAVLQKGRRDWAEVRVVR